MISLVAAMTRDHVIGIDDRLPWHIDEEIKHFREIIRGKNVILGRNTYELMKNHLETAHNIIITHNKIDAPNVYTCDNLEDALAKARSYSNEVFVIGGQSIFEQALPFADTMQLSYVKKSYEGNKFFPKFNEDEWKVESREDFEDFEYVVYKKRAVK